MRSTRYALPSGLAIAILVTTACGGGGGDVTSTVKDFSISLDSSTVSSGEVTFNITNDGPSTHEFVVVKTDLAPDALPTVEENGVKVVEEDSSELKPVDEAEDIKSGTSTDLTVNVDPGKYVVFCNIPAHYIQGMSAGFTAT